MANISNITLNGTNYTLTASGGGSGDVLIPSSGFQSGDTVGSVRSIAGTEPVTLSEGIDVYLYEANTEWELVDPLAYENQNVFLGYEISAGANSLSAYTSSNKLHIGAIDIETISGTGHIDIYAYGDDGVNCYEYSGSGVFSAYSGSFITNEWTDSWEEGEGDDTYTYYEFASEATIEYLNPDNETCQFLLWSDGGASGDTYLYGALGLNYANTDTEEQIPTTFYIPYLYSEEGGVFVKGQNSNSKLLEAGDMATINGSAITNGGNIVISGGGSGGGETVIELTQAQYDALSAYAPDTTYIITDSTPINLDDYATTADTEAIAEDIAALSGDVADKADKANVSANSNRQFPKWNAQGIVTGTTGNTVYERSLSINGTSKTMLQTTNSDFTGIYAPTSAGTQYQPLLSNGSGAPVWASYKFQFITQTQYDALSTKDSTTIYFITGD